MAEAMNGSGRCHREAHHFSHSPVKGLAAAGWLLRAWIDRPWRQLWTRAAEALERRRQQLQVVAEAVAKELGGLWPGLAVWLGARARLP